MTTVIPLRSTARMTWEPIGGEAVQIHDKTMLSTMMTWMSEFAEMAWVRSVENPQAKVLVGYLGEDGWVMWTHHHETYPDVLKGRIILWTDHDRESPWFEPYKWTDFATISVPFEGVHTDATNAAELIWHYLEEGWVAHPASVWPIPERVALPQPCESVAEALEFFRKDDEVELSDEVAQAILEFGSEIEAHDVMVAGTNRFTVRVPNQEDRVVFWLREDEAHAGVTGLRGEIGGEYALLLPSREVTTTSELGVRV